MKTTYIYFLILLNCLFFTSIKAQLNLGSNLAPNADAILQLSSNSKGMLLSLVPLQSTILPAPLSANVQGMMVYNTATAGSGSNAVVPGIYVNDGSKWIQLAISAIAGGATFIGGTLNCSGTLSGNYAVGIDMAAENTKQISINAATPGAYIATTNTLNGVTFATTGTIQNSGAITITLVASGLPLASGAYPFTVSLGGQTCQFTVNFTNGASFNCAAATETHTPGGVFNSGSYTGTYTIPYTSGNGGNYTAVSTTMSGLTLTRVAGNYSAGGGNVLYDLSGSYTGPANGTVSFPISECTTATFGDALRSALSTNGCTSCSLYDAAATNTWVNITAVEFSAVSGLTGMTTNGAQNSSQMQSSEDNGGSPYTDGMNTTQTNSIPTANYIVALKVQSGGIQTSDWLGVKLKISNTNYKDNFSDWPSSSASFPSVTTAINTSYYFLLKKPTLATTAESFMAIFDPSGHAMGYNHNSAGGYSYYINSDANNLTILSQQNAQLPVQVLSTAVKQW